MDRDVGLVGFIFKLLNDGVGFLASRARITWKRLMQAALILPVRGLVCHLDDAPMDVQEQEKDLAEYRGAPMPSNEADRLAWLGTLVHGWSLMGSDSTCKRHTCEQWFNDAEEHDKQQRAFPPK